jgi:cyclic pyranopterin phosphate synthase
MVTVLEGLIMNSIYLRLSVFNGCNLRCTYCRPAQESKLSAPRPGLSTADLADLVFLINQEVKVSKLRLTGGEPLLRPDIIELVACMRQRLPESELCMTTNGSRLAELASDLKAAGLDRVNVSLDTVDAELYATLTRGGSLQKVLDGLTKARQAGFDRIKLNSVLLQSFSGDVLLHLVRQMAGLVEDIRFIELMPISVAAGMHRIEFLAADQARQIIEREWGSLTIVQTADIVQGGTLQVEGKTLNVGFIPSVTKPFCADCDRLRMDWRGRLFACLRHPDWLDLSTPLRAGDANAVKRSVRRVLDSKRPPDSVWPGRQMSAIGG